MDKKLSRTENLLGKENILKLKNSCVAIFGIGGVGGYVLEALVRCGIENIDLFDSDNIDITNFNRQILATDNTLGKPKAEVGKQRALSINNKANINTFSVFYTPENADCYDLSKYDYVIDAIDTVSSKIELIVRCNTLNIPIISCMGTGNKLNPTMLQVSDIYKTSVCPLARVMRYELKKKGIKKLKVVYSKEIPIKPENQISQNNRHIPASIPFVPASAGFIIASEVVKDICNI